MLGKLGRRLTYANVMATLAFFFALGGTSYAVARIDGGLLKNRSVPGKKLKRNSVGPAEVNEARLGRVPNAAHASRADTAGLADKATSADSATSAANALALGGLSSATYELATRIVFGQKQANGNVPTDIVDDPKMGVQVMTDGAGNDGHLDVRVHNTRAAGGGSISMATAGGNFNVAAPGQAPQIGDAGGNDTQLQLFITESGGAGRSFLVTCTVDTLQPVATQQERCYGIRSSP